MNRICNCNSDINGLITPKKSVLHQEFRLNWTLRDKNIEYAGESYITAGGFTLIYLFHYAGSDPDVTERRGQVIPVHQIVREKKENLLVIPVEPQGLVRVQWMAASDRNVAECHPEECRIEMSEFMNKAVSKWWDRTILRRRDVKWLQIESLDASQNMEGIRTTCEMIPSETNVETSL